MKIKDCMDSILFQSLHRSIKTALESAVKGRANLRGANLIGANLIGANLRGAYLEEANLRGANLRGAYLRIANLVGANLREANLEGANLREANLREANLVGANLEVANLEGANLVGANLEGANLVGANLRGAYLEEANLRGATGLEAPVVKDIDAAILASIEANKAAGTNGLDMSTWHGQNCDETNWCETTHCRAGYAICLAGRAGFELERKFGAAVAGMLIYLASTPNESIPDFYASNTEALADMQERAARQLSQK